MSLPPRGSITPGGSYFEPELEGRQERPRRRRKSRVMADRTSERWQRLRAATCGPDEHVDRIWAELERRKESAAWTHAD